VRHISPIIYITDECKLTSKYCYNGSSIKKFSGIENINKKFKNSIPLFFKFIDELILYNDFTPTNFFFHGGEPLLINLENWKTILGYFRKKEYPISPKIQTNGTLINDDFISLFKEFNVGIGISIDGPAFLNDQTRIFKNGSGTFSTIFKNIQKLKDAGIEFGCLVTLNETNIKYINEIYEFFKENNISFDIRPIFDTRYSVPKNLLITPQEFAEAWCKLFDLWFDDNEVRTSLIKDFNDFVAGFIRPDLFERMSICTFDASCAEHFLCYDMEGNIWHCDNLRGVPKFWYGNIQKESLTNILNSSKVKKLSKRFEVISKTKECKDCKFMKWHHCGCPARSYHYYGNYFKKDYFCESYELIFGHVYERIKSSIGKSKLLK